MPSSTRLYASELRKPLLDRRVPFLAFLDKERSVYTFGISLLEDLQHADAVGADERYGGGRSQEDPGALSAGKLL